MKVKKIYLGISTLVIAIAALTAVNFTGTNTMAVTAGARDCNNNSIVYCGALTQAELLSKYDQNATKDLPAIYAHYGIARSDMDGTTSQVVMGTAFKDGHVEVNGKTVASNSVSLGRDPIPHSTPVNINGITYYESTSPNVFLSDIAAFVLMRNGQFYRAILTSCSNPLTATPTPPPAPTPTPPAPVTTPESTPVYTCNSLSAQVISLTDRSYEYTLNYTATGGATLTSVDYNFGDQQSQSVTASSSSMTQTVQHTYQSPGSYKTVATLHFSVPVNGQPTVKDVNCEVPINTAPAMCTVPGKENFPQNSPECTTPTVTATPPTPPAPTVVPQELPHTGIGSLLSGTLGLGSLSAAGYYWRGSRRNLLDKLRNQ